MGLCLRTLCSWSVGHWYKPWGWQRDTTVEPRGKADPACVSYGEQDVIDTKQSSPWGWINLYCKFVRGWEIFVFSLGLHRFLSIIKNICSYIDSLTLWVTAGVGYFSVHVWTSKGGLRFCTLCAATCPTRPEGNPGWLGEPGQPVEIRESTGIPFWV